VFNALASLYDSEAEAVTPESAAAEAAAPEAALAGATQSHMLAVTIDTASTDGGANTGVCTADDLPPAAPAPPTGTATEEHEPALDAAAAETHLTWLPAANDPGIEEVVAANDPVADAEALGIRPPAPESIERLDIDLGALSPAAEEWHVVPQLQPATVGSIDLAAPETDRQHGADAELIPVYDLDGDRDLPQGRPEGIETPEPAAPTDSAAQSHGRPSEEPTLAELAPAQETPRHARLWAAGSAVLGLLLVGQWIHHQRETLVGWPALAEPLTRLYAAIGRPIRLRGDLGAYDVRQLGAVAAADAAGTLTVRASLRNLSPRPQPMPLLRVTLQDRYGNRIASRDLTAAEYQQRRAGTAPMTLLAAGARLETSVQLVDPGGNAVGFELDVCLAESGATRCASDLAATTSR
jgi:hypothetical protein